MIIFQALKSLVKEDMYFLFPSLFLTGAYSLLIISLDLCRISTQVFYTFCYVLDRKLPSSFKTSVGKVVHKLRAELKQSMKLTKKAKVHFAFVSKADMDIPGLMVRNHLSYKHFYHVCCLMRKQLSTCINTWQGFVLLGATVW